MSTSDEGTPMSRVTLTSKVDSLATAVEGLTGIVAEMAAELYSAKLAADPVAAAARMPKLQSAAPVVEAAEQDEEPRLYLFSADYPTLQKKNGRPIIGGTFKTTKSGNRFIVRATKSTATRRKSFAARSTRTPAKLSTTLSHQGPGSFTANRGYIRFGRANIGKAGIPVPSYAD